MHLAVCLRRSSGSAEKHSAQILRDHTLPPDRGRKTKRTWVCAAYTPRYSGAEMCIYIYINTIYIYIYVYAYCKDHKVWIDYRQVSGDCTN